jgi:hypothetical protein
MSATKKRAPEGARFHCSAPPSPQVNTVLAVVMAFVLGVVLDIGCGGSGTSGASATGATTGGTSSGTTGSGGEGPCAGELACDDGCACTIDSCHDGACIHTIGPNAGDTRCDDGTYCDLAQCCTPLPACATAADCEAIWEGDACKANIACDPVSSICSFETLDKDGDGHPPQICGGDDCDDSSANRFPGNTEVCDEVDNDCDGDVDEYVNGPENCGGCGIACPSGATCSDNGDCQCPGTTPGVCNGACVDFAADVVNCGQCAHPCAGGAECSAGTCQCPPAFPNACNVCVNLASDPTHCGQCNLACPIGASCVNSSCVCPANAPDDCGSCVDLASDHEHCGGCNVVCPANADCVAGQCACQDGAGYIVCGNTCVDGQNDPLNCGTCGKTCALGCAGGTCLACDGGLTVADPDPMNAAKAIGLCLGVQSAKWVQADGTPPPIEAQQLANFHLGHGILDGLGPNNVPQEGSRLLALSSGTARKKSDPQYVHRNFDKGYTSGYPAGFPIESASCPGVATSTPHDATGLEVKVMVPPAATGFSFDFEFFTFEWPGTICSTSDDFFLAILTPTPPGLWNGNIVFDAHADPMSVNNAYLDACGCPGGSFCMVPPGQSLKAFDCTAGTTLLQGTDFATDDAHAGWTNGGTAWLRTSAPATAGTTITVRFVTYDSANGTVDSMTLIDNWQWLANPNASVQTILSPNPL